MQLYANNINTSPGFAEAFRCWLRLGFISFGGPAGQIAMLHEELVVRRRWIGEDDFLQALNYCMLLPGPEAQQLATYAGWLLHGLRGGLVAGLLFILPSAFMLLGLSMIYVAFGHMPQIAALFDGLQPAVLAVVMLALVRIARRTLRGPVYYGLAVLAFVALYFFQVPFPIILLAVIGFGFLALRVAPAWITGSPPQRAAAIQGGSARTGWRKPGLMLLAALALWALPLLILAGTAPDFTFWRGLAIFFTKAAFVTFGGAYAVLPYVAQVAVEKFHWLTEEQMLDGLALGESTPGPLIMVLAFVGFMAGAGRFAGSLAAGSLGLLVTVYYTFLPSFVFILVGAPLIERVRLRPGLKAVLGLVTAAVLGVMGNLALYLGQAVLWPAPGNLRVFALIWLVFSLLALGRFKNALIPWLIVSALAGLGIHAFGG